MLHGDISAQVPEYAINHKCIFPDGSVRDTPGFPDEAEKCLRIRGEVTFPSCWDGQNLDSDNHKSHMAYPQGGWQTGPCPSTHPKRVPTLFFEAKFLSYGLLDAGDSLVYSYNDWKGYGFHGDFLNGWNEGVMEQLIEVCTFLDDPSVRNCGLDKSSSYNCAWEGWLQEDQFKGEFDELPPWGSF